MTMEQTTAKPVFALSIDWEDFGQLYCKQLLHQVRPPRDGDIDRQTDIILELFDGANVKGTFFILGLLAQYRPDLVRKIAAQGHEIALHGMRHEALFNLTPEQARADLSDSQKLVSDIVNRPVLGYRAPYFSVTAKNLYVLDILAELGFVYDSSIFPLKTSRYGIQGYDPNNRLCRLNNGSEIVELPLMVWRKFGRLWPVAGGGYMRAMPLRLLKWIYRQIDGRDTSGMIYMHPYEFDTEKIDVASCFPENHAVSPRQVALLNARWNLFRQSIRGKIGYLLDNFRFSTCLEIARDVAARSPRLEQAGPICHASRRQAADVRTSANGHW